VQFNATLMDFMRHWVHQSKPTIKDSNFKTKSLNMWVDEQRLDSFRYLETKWH
jgi:hypothetical protein